MDELCLSIQCPPLRGISEEGILLHLVVPAFVFAHGNLQTQSPSAEEIAAIKSEVVSKIAAINGFPEVSASDQTAVKFFHSREGDPMLNFEFRYAECEFDLKERQLLSMKIRFSNRPILSELFSRFDSKNLAISSLGLLFPATEIQIQDRNPDFAEVFSYNFSPMYNGIRLDSLSFAGSISVDRTQGRIASFRSWPLPKKVKPIPPLLSDNVVRQMVTEQANSKMGDGPYESWPKVARQYAYPTFKTWNPAVIKVVDVSDALAAEGKQRVARVMYFCRIRKAGSSDQWSFAVLDAESKKLLCVFHIPS